MKNNGRKTPAIFSNERTAASAGSGKTHALTTRFIALAAKETHPETGLPDPTCIAALTFTRKSAGEFLSKILTRLAEAASDDNAAKNLSAEIETLSTCASANRVGGNFITRAQIAELLKQFIKNLNRLHLGTIDSFCASMLRAYSPELRLFAPVSVMGEFQRAAEENAAIDGILQAQSVDEKMFADFAEYVKRASFGLEEKSLKKTLGDILKSAQKIYLETPNLGLWGNASAITPDKLAEWNGEKYSAEIAEMEAGAEFGQLKPVLARLSDFFKNSNAYTVAKTNAVADCLSELYRNGGLAGEVFFKYNRKEYALPPPLSARISNLFKLLFDAHLARVCEASKALGEIAKIYEDWYGRNVRDKGRLNFDDIPFILNDSQRKINKRLLEERLDARFRHWMFDEFQDTSRTQWDVFRDIIDDAIADDDRTFYYVGDIKQSLYSWRGGDYRLFNEIFNYYNKNNPDAIQEGGELYVSWRSGESVISAVNAVFENTAELGAAFTQNAGAAFGKMFTRHVSAESNPQLKKKKASFAQLSIVENTGRNAQEQFEKLCDKVFEILKSANPTSRGKSCAILVNDNKLVRKYVEGLRRRIAESGADIPVAGELETPISRDNLIIPPFIQILKKISHPLDTASSVYVDMTPAAKFTDGFSEAFTKGALAEISARGFEKFAEKYVDFLRGETDVSDAYSKLNIEWLADACMEFDAGGSRDADEFISYIESKKIKTGTAENTVQVMTIHKSKGLGFSMTILPDIYEIEVKVRGGLKYVYDEIIENGEPKTIQQGVMLFPPQAVCALNGKLYANLMRERDNEAFEAICKLYVAATRAEEAVYFVMPEIANYEFNSGKNISIKQLMFNAFNADIRAAEDLKTKKGIFEERAASAEFSIGEPDWYLRNLQNADEEKPLKINPLIHPKISDALHRAAAPSKRIDGHSENVPAEFAEYGTALHKVFENITAIADSMEKTVDGAIKSARIDEILHDKVLNSALNILANPNIRKYFDCDENAKIFNEYAFDMIWGDSRISGAIDKLIVYYGNRKTPQSAVILDFKSGSPSSVEAAKRQLDIYKTAVGKIFNLKPENIAAKLICYLDSSLIEI